ncbi:MAG: hypothetical protein PHY92_03195 [Alphaproteobacteria bacterium]|nr:hypothetical protein [Alphaproteobacteria bacterium]
MTRRNSRAIHALVLASVFSFLSPVLAQTPPQAATPSLFFNSEELNRIEAAVNKTEPNGDAAKQEAVTLGAVVYYGPKNWTVWLQGERWTPATKRPDLQILDVKPDLVRLAFAPQNGAKKREITLRPYQSFQPDTGQILEGGK